MGGIWTEGEAFPILAVTSSCTFYDYFTDASKTYRYYVGGGYYDYEANNWDTAYSEDSMPQQGVATDDPITGSSKVSYNSTTGFLTFDPPLKGPNPHVSAGTPKVRLQFDNGLSEANQLYDGSRSEIDLTVVPFESWFNKTVPIKIMYSPVYEETNSISNILYVVSYPNNHYKLTGDIEGLVIPESSTEKPAMPENVSAAEIGDTQITLTWKQTLGASGYHVERADSRNGEYTQIGSVSIHEYTDKDLTPSTTYWYKVVAYNSAGESLSSLPFKATTLVTGETLLSAPVVYIAEQTESSITLAWSSVSGATAYKIHRENSTTEPLATTVETSYKDTGLMPNTGYYYTVSAYNESGESPQSASLLGQTTATTGEEVTELTAPTGVTAVAQVDGFIRVSWNAVEGTSGYEIHFATSANGNYYYYDADWTTDTWYIDSEVDHGQT